MQKCQKCGASWDVKAVFEICPFCGTSLNDKFNLDSIESVLKIILERHGKETLYSSALLGFLGDYAPSLQKERKLIKVALESGAYKAICLASDRELQNIFNRYISVLTDSYFIDETWARKVLAWCIHSLDNKDTTNQKDRLKFDKEITPSAQVKHVTQNETQIYNSSADSDLINRKESSEEQNISGKNEFLVGRLAKKAMTWCKHSLNKKDLSDRDTNFRLNKDETSLVENHDEKDTRNNSIAIGAYSISYEELSTDEVRTISDINEFPGDCWSRDKSWNMVRSIVIKDSIEQLPMEAFSQMKKLQSVTFPNNLKKIGFAAFKDCTELNNLVIPNSVTTIYAHAFEGCTSLKSVIIPNSVRYIGDNAFSGCPCTDLYVNSSCVICSGNYQVKNKI